jgi:cardiolipin synthase
MAMTVPLGWLILEGRYFPAMVLFFVAGFTDLVDGFLARTFGWKTRLGGILDPIADKLLVATAFVTLALAGFVPVWLLVVVLVRDAVIIGGSLAYQAFVAPFEAAPTGVSKLTTLLQLTYLLLALSAAALGFPDQRLLGPLAVLVAAAAVISGLAYVVMGVRLARRARV